MTQKKFLKRLAEIYKINVEISRKKNADYASSDDAFKNFRGGEALGITVEQGILVRMMDKMVRASNLTKRKALVADESVLDTLSDLANYAMILRMYIEQKVIHTQASSHTTRRVYNSNEMLPKGTNQLQYGKGRSKKINSTRVARNSRRKGGAIRRAARVAHHVPVHARLKSRRNVPTKTR